MLRRARGACWQILSSLGVAIQATLVRLFGRKQLGVECTGLTDGLLRVERSCFAFSCKLTKLSAGVKAHSCKKTSTWGLTTETKASVSVSSMYLVTFLGGDVAMADLLASQAWGRCSFPSRNIACNQQKLRLTLGSVSSERLLAATSVSLRHLHVCVRSVLSSVLRDCAKQSHKRVTADSEPLIPKHHERLGKASKDSVKHCCWQDSASRYSPCSRGPRPRCHPS